MPKRQSPARLQPNIWMLLCDACFVKYGGDIDGALKRGQIHIACDMVWPEGGEVNFVKH